MEPKILKKTLMIVAAAVVVAALLASVGLNIYFALCYVKGETYLQTTDEIYVMEAGILRNNLEFHGGQDYEFKYDFSHADYSELKSKYDVETIAGEGTEFQRAARLMDEFALRLTHASNYDNHVGQSALKLLEYSLNNKHHGINCRAKAQILNEMCLSLGIFARKVWIMPYSDYDTDCHVVNEVFDTSLNKWVMLDITNNTYWVDENNEPLSILEIRDKAALGKFCTPVEVGDKTGNLQKVWQKNIGNFLYIVKNLTYMKYCMSYTVGESRPYSLLPQNMPGDDSMLISRAAVECAPSK